MGKRIVSASSRWRQFGLAVAINILAATPTMVFAKNDSSAFDAATQAYRKVVTAEIDGVIASAERMAAAMQQGDFATARKAWIESHAGWERLEVITVDLFPDQQHGIDGWPKAKTGYHAVEAWLFAPTSLAPKWATDDLLDELNSFRRVFAQADLNGYFLLSGAATLAYAIGAEEANGSESVISGTSLDDVRHNMEGLDYVWKTIFADAVAAKKKYLVEEINKQIADLFALIAVPSMHQLDQSRLQQEAYDLAANLAEAAVALGWVAPDYTDLD